MSRRYPSLPTGRPGPVQHHLPQYLTQEAQSTESTNSTDSIHTQVPLPYHLSGYEDTELMHGPLPKLRMNPSSANYVPGYVATSSSASASANMYSAAPAPGPILNSGPILPANQSFGSHSSMQSSVWSRNGNGADSRDSSFSSGMALSANNGYQGYAQQPHFTGPVYNPSVQAQQQAHYAYTPAAAQNTQQYAGYPPAAATQQAQQFTGYPPTMSPMMQGQYSGYAPQGYAQQQDYVPQNYAEPSSYHPATDTASKYGPSGTPYAAPVVAKSTFNHPYSSMSGRQMSYASSSMVSPTMTHTTMANSPIQNFQTTVYTDTKNLGAAKAWGSIYDTGANKKATGQAQAAGVGASTKAARAGDSSANSKVDKGKGKEVDRSFSSDSAPLVTFDKSKDKSRPSTPAAIKKPEGKVNESSSPEKTVSRPSSQPTLASEDTKVNSEVLPTPGANPRQLDIDFKSEPRAKEATPTLRSRRGQTVSSSSATEPLRKNSTTVTKWLANTPTQNELTLEEATATIRRHQGSPPKMDLIHGMNGLNINGRNGLTPVNDHDPFVTRRQPPLLRAPMSGATARHQTASKELAIITRNGTSKPTFEDAIQPHNLPFVEYCRLAKEDTYGVIKIKNIPYSVNRPEVLAFLGRNARIVNENDNEPIHIIMERVTSKTLDCYVEFINFHEAVAAVERFEVNRANGRGGRLGQRHVDIELSSQEALMHDLFPKAKNVVWKGAHPTIIAKDPNDRYNSGFQGFVSREELVMLVKHVEAPQRSPFSKECPQRPFECLISTLLKFPWHMVDYITIQDRAYIHEATKDLLSLLVERVNNSSQDCNLTSMLLKRVWKAALKCPGFTPIMKDDIMVLANLDSSISREYGLAPFADLWDCLYTIGPKTDAPSDVVLWYVAVMREAMERAKPRLSLAEQAASGAAALKPKFWSNLEDYIGHDKKVLYNMTLAAVAKAEWAALEHVLHMALAG